jgi:hypothetical protein
MNSPVRSSPNVSPVTLARVRGAVKDYRRVSQISRPDNPCRGCRRHSRHQRKYPNLTLQMPS